MCHCTNVQEDIHNYAISMGLTHVSTHHTVDNGMAHLCMYVHIFVCKNFQAFVELVSLKQEASPQGPSSTANKQLPTPILVLLLQP